VKRLAARVGLYRVAAILIGCALVLEIVRVQVVAGNEVAVVACTVGEIAFLAVAAGVFVAARHGTRRRD